MPDRAGGGRGFARDAVVYGLANAFARASTFALLPLLTRRLTSSSIGALALASTTLALLQTLSVSGLDNAGGRWYFSHTDDKDRRTTLTTWVVTQSVLAFVLASVVAVLIISVGGDSSSATELRSLCLITAATIAVAPMGTIAANWLRFERRVFASAILNLLSGVGSFVIALLLLLLTGAGAASVALGLFVAAALASIAGVACLRPQLSWASMSRRRLREMTAFAMPFLPGGLALWAIALSDRFLVQRFFGRGAVGRYQVAQTIASGILLVTFAFQQVWGPWAFSRSSDEKSNGQFRSALQIYLFVVGAGVVVLSFTAKEFLQIATTGAYRGLTPDIAILAVANLLIGTMYIGIAGPSIAKKTRSSGGAMVFAAIVNASLNLLLIPHFGVRGAAISTAIGYLTVTVTLFVIGQRVYPLPYDFVRAAATFAVICAGCAGGVLSQDRGAGERVVLVLATIGAVAGVGLSGLRRSSGREAQRSMIRSNYGRV